MPDQPAPTPPGFLAARWRGDVPAGRILFVDMLVAGTAINLAATFASLMVLGLKFPPWAAMAVYALPIPYNIFLTISLWRATAGRPAGQASAWRLAALCWLAAASLL